MKIKIQDGGLQRMHGLDSIHKFH